MTSKRINNQPWYTQISQTDNSAPYWYTAATHGWRTIYHKQIIYHITKTETQLIKEKYMYSKTNHSEDVFQQ